MHMGGSNLIVEYAHEFCNEHSDQTQKFNKTLQRCLK